MKKKDISSFEGLYAVTRDGRVWSYPKKFHTNDKNNAGQWLKNRMGTTGYLGVLLVKDGVYREKRINRLVAETYIPNPKNLPVVNHKNGRKTDNRVSNLEWVTHSENKLHSIKLKSTMKDKKWFDEQNQLFKEYLEEGDISPAKYVIQDMFDAGFAERAREMNEELRAATEV